MRRWFYLLVSGAFSIFAIGMLSGLMCCAGVQNKTKTPGSEIVYPAVMKVAAHDNNCVGYQKLEDIRLCLAFMKTQGDPGGPTGGSAFWISDHYVVTAQHVALYAEADPGARLIVNQNESLYQKVLVKQWLHFGDVDVSIGYVENPPSHAILDLCAETYESEAAEVRGYPGWGGYETAEARVVGTYGDMLILATAIRGGYSGGPVVSNDRQCVLGVAVQSAANNNPPLGLAVPASALQTFILIVYDALTPVPKTSS